MAFRMVPDLYVQKQKGQLNVGSEFQMFSVKVLRCQYMLCRELERVTVCCPA